MKTITIFNAYAISEWEINPRRNRQRRKFEIALLSRIEEGDRARTIVREIAEVYKHEDWYSEYGFRTQKIIEKHTDWLEELL